MAIKKLDADSFEKIAKDTEYDSLKDFEDETEEFELSHEEYEKCLNHGLKDLLNIGNAFLELNYVISDSAFGFALTNTPEYQLFVQSLNEYCTKIIPLLLEGDIDSIIENADSLDMSPEKFREELESLRGLFFSELVKKI